MLSRGVSARRSRRVMDVTTSSEDADESRPAPDVFRIVLKKLKLVTVGVVAIGDTLCDAMVARKTGIATIGVLCGGFTEDSSAGRMH